MKIFKIEMEKKMFKFRMFIILSSMLLILVSPVQAKTKATFWYALTGYLGDQVEIVCDRFNESQSDFEITCVGKGGYAAAVQSAIAAYRAGRQPTIVQASGSDTLTLMLSGAFYPVYRLMTDHGHDLEAVSFINGVVENFGSGKGYLYGMPFNVSTPVMYYNVSMFQKAGIERPPETWEQFEKDMQTLRSSGVDCPYAESPHAWTHLAQLHAMHNSPVATKNNGFEGLDARYDFQALQIEHIELLKRMHDKKLMHIYGPLMGKSSGISAREAFASGRCAVSTSSIAGHATVYSLADPTLDWAVAKMPVHENYRRHNSYVDGAALWVFKGRPDEEYDAAAAFLKYLTSTDAQKFWASVTGYMPLTLDAYESLKADGFYTKPEYAGRDVAIESVGISNLPTRGVRLGNFNQMQSIWKEELDRVITGRKDVRTGVSDMIRRGNVLLEDFEQTYKGATLP